MKKQSKQLIFLIIICIFLVIALVVLKNINKKEAEKENESESVTLKTIPMEEITAFSYLFNGETYSYTKTGDEWQYDGDTSLNLDESQIEDMLSTITTIEAEEEITDADGLEEYGLSEPFETITIQKGDEMTNIYIGNYNDIVSAYYFMLDNSEKIYTKSGGFCEAFQNMPQDMIEEEESVSDNTADDTEEAVSDDITDEADDQ